MINTNRPVLNLDLDLLRTFVAVADLNTFAAAATLVCRTQSAVSQQMQRLDQLVGKELFVRQGRNKLLTEHGTQLLGYARKILRYNDEAYNSLMYSTMEGKLTIGASEVTAETLLPAVLNRISTFYPKLTLDLRITRGHALSGLIDNDEVDLAITTEVSDQQQHLIRRSPTVWYSAADYQARSGQPIPLVVMEEPCSYREMAIKQLSQAGLAWRIAYVASTQSAIIAACKAGIGLMVAPIEIMRPEFRVMGREEGMPELPDSQYLLTKNNQAKNELAGIIFSAIEQCLDSHKLPALPSEDDELDVESEVH